jgi:hypothetical protein
LAGVREENVLVAQPMKEIIINKIKTHFKK